MAPVVLQAWKKLEAIHKDTLGAMLIKEVPPRWRTTGRTLH